MNAKDWRLRYMRLGRRLRSGVCRDDDDGSDIDTGIRYKTEAAAAAPGTSTGSAS